VKLNCLACTVVVRNKANETELIKVFTTVLTKVFTLCFRVLATLTQILIKHQVKPRLIWANTLLLLPLRYIQTSVLIACFSFGLFANKAK
jgi:hypothetical protein